jgi:DNA-binding GntR family transcriptional regulator
MNLNDLAKKALAQHKTTPALVADIIRQAILQGLIKAGEPLRQEDLAARFGVSRMPVREAIYQLQAEGLVSYYPHRGAVVASLSYEEAQEIYEIRVALETAALTLAIPRLSPTDLDAARQLLVISEQTQDVAKWGELNWQFHATLYNPAQRPRLLAMIKNLHTQVDRYMRLELSVMHYKPTSQAEHYRLLEACQSQKTEEAVLILKEHIQAAGELLVAYLKKQEQEQAQEGASKNNGGTET